MAEGARGGQAQARFHGELRSVPQARQFVMDTVDSWEAPGGVAWAAALAVTELATNAVLHAATDFGVAMSLEDELLRLEVSDGSARRPRLRHYGPEATTGRGLALVAKLSRQWGSFHQASGKTVWCTLAVSALLDEAPEPDLDAFADLLDEPALHQSDAPRSSSAVVEDWCLGVPGRVAA